MSQRKDWISLALCAAATILAGCDGRPIADEASAAVGDDRDVHGCIASAGYQFCARTGECERPWELAEKAGFENTEAAFTEYCAAGE